MSLHPAEMAPVPAETARVARAAFPKSTLAMRIRDELGDIYRDEMFADLYASAGRPALAPWRLALVTVLQFVETLSDRQAAEAVRSRIDWKDALGLELTDPGFDVSVLSEFCWRCPAGRTRLIEGGLEEQLLAALVERCRARGLVRARGRCRTDSTPILAAVRVLSRLERVGETLRAALNSVARVAPDGLAAQVAPDGFERYARRVEDDRRPEGEAARRASGETMGRDGHDLLAAVWAPGAPSELRVLPAVQMLRRFWIQQFYCAGDQVRWREGKDLPPAALALTSPYDGDARYGIKRRTSWIGCKAHLTENCEDDTPHLIVQVETASAPENDADRAAPIQTALVARGLTPATHLLDGGYVDAGLLVQSRADPQIEVLGPVRPDPSWQANTPGGYALSAFTLDWTRKTATCPQGQSSRDWTTGTDSWGNPVVVIQFAGETCAGCPARERCTRAKHQGRSLTVRTQAEHEARQQARRDQETAAWKARYAKRAGIEGTISQAIRAFGLRQCRYIGYAKARLQHMITAAALNFVRLDAWLCGEPRAQTRCSSFARIQPIVA